jgi:precorrin-6B methylase 2
MDPDHTRFSVINLLLLAVFIASCVCGLSCQRGSRWSEEWEEKFEAFQPSEKIMDAIGILPGMVIGEVGAGNGRFAVKVAQRVGQDGLIYANDIDKKALDFMKKRLKHENINNMVIVEGDAVDPHFPLSTLDMVYIINTYHVLDQPVELMKNIAPSLKPNGRLVIMVMDPEKIDYSTWHATPKKILLNQVEKAGLFDLIRIDTFLPNDTIYIFRLNPLQ